MAKNQAPAHSPQPNPPLFTIDRTYRQPATALHRVLRAPVLSLAAVLQFLLLRAAVFAPANVEWRGGIHNT